MKKLLILFALIASLLTVGNLCFGQTGTITECPQCDFFGNKLDYVVYKSPRKTNHWVVFLPGTGEMGIGDGTQLYKVYKHSFPALIKAGIDFNDFNILIIQPNTKYYGTHKDLLPWIHMEFKPTKVILVGLSLGGIEGWDELLMDRYHRIDGFVSLSGKPSGGAAVVPNMVTVPIYVYHGDKDTDVSYSVGIKAFKAYDALHPGYMTWDIRAGVGHGGWTDACAYAGPIHAWIVNQFGPEESDDDYQRGYLDALKKISSAADSIANTLIVKK